MLDELGKTFAAAEEAGSWEEAVGVAITALIPKGDGGWRPVGLFPTVVRVLGLSKGGVGGLSRNGTRGTRASVCMQEKGRGRKLRHAN